MMVISFMSRAWQTLVLYIYKVANQKQYCCTASPPLQNFIPVTQYSLNGHQGNTTNKYFTRLVFSSLVVDIRLFLQMFKVKLTSEIGTSFKDVIYLQSNDEPCSICHQHAEHVPMIRGGIPQYLNNQMMKDKQLVNRMWNDLNRNIQL